jgi:acetyl-CoA carboxylase biotin carboxyl carrier protein
LTEDEVLQILNLIEKSNFDFLQLELGDLKLTVSKTGFVPSTATNPSQAQAQVSQAPARSGAEPQRETPAAAPAQPAAKPAPPSVMEGTLAIPAPMVGTFYITSEPGAPPFVELGAHVDEDTTVGLIEVMKVFNAVKSGVRGTIAQVAVENGQFIEYGQTLFLVRPDGVPNSDEGQ